MDIDFSQFGESIRIVNPQLSTDCLTVDEIAKQIQSDEKIRNFLREPTLLIINDAHRATPSYVVTEALLSIEENKITQLAIATGTHSPPSEEEIDKLVRGKAKKLPLLVHSAHEELEEYTYWGRTDRGTEVYLNKIIDNFDRILCINSVEPHYFAGYTGGVKSIIPGLASFKTVEKNHSWALDKGSAPGRTRGNQLYEDFWDAFNLLKSKEVMGIHLVLLRGEIVGMTKGELRVSQEEAISIADRMYTHFFDHKVDRIVSIVDPPLNRSFYQSQKGLENTRAVLKEGGKILLVSSCHEGIGNTAFFDTLERLGSKEEVIQNLSREKYNFGDHKARKLADLAKIASIYTTAELSENELKTLFLNKIAKSEVLDFVREGVENTEEVVVCFDAGMNVLALND